MPEDYKEVIKKKFDIEDKLTNVYNSFEEWRYIYEKDKSAIDSGFLGFLCKTLKEMTNNL